MMNDQELKNILLNEPTPTPSVNFSKRMVETLQRDFPPLESSNFQTSVLTSSNQSQILQYLLMGIMVLLAVTVFSIHQIHDHNDNDDLSRINVMSELSLSTI